MTFSAASLRELHRIHRQLSDLRERLDRGPKQIKARQATIAAAEEKLAKTQAESKAGRIACDAQQLNLRSGEAKILELETKLNQAGTNREYQALRDQIAADKMANSVLADEILEAMEKVDGHKKFIGEAEQQVIKAKEELSKVQQTVRSQAESLLSDVHRLEEELRTAEAALPAEFREPYQRIVKAKGEDALAQVDAESCGGCHQQLTPNVLSQLASAKAVFCKTCGRLLYLPEDRTSGRVELMDAVHDFCNTPFATQGKDESGKSLQRFEDLIETIGRISRLEVNPLVAKRIAGELESRFPHRADWDEKVSQPHVRTQILQIILDGLKSAARAK